MKHLFHALLISLIVSASVHAQSKQLASVITFASEQEAISLLKQEDDFSKSWSVFDIQSRLKKQNGTKSELLDFIAKQARSWTEAEKTQLKAIAAEIDNTLAKGQFKLDFPESIIFVKTTGIEEGGAIGYTRSNYVVLKEDAVNLPEEELKRLVIHEVFHVLTRKKPEFRKAMYSIVGFELTAPIAYPATLKEVRITNPDATQTDNYIKLTVKGKKHAFLMVLYAKRPFDGGAFFSYLNAGFMQLEGDKEKKPVLVDGKPIIYSIGEVEGFFEQVGQNTDYIIHPEEILAENFAHAVLGYKGLKSQHIVDAISAYLKK